MAIAPTELRVGPTSGGKLDPNNFIGVAWREAPDGGLPRRSIVVGHAETASTLSQVAFRAARDKTTRRAETNAESALSPAPVKDQSQIVGFAGLGALACRIHAFTRERNEALGGFAQRSAADALDDFGGM